MKAGLDVYARICSVADNSSSPPPPPPPMWWSMEQMKQFCSSWEKCLYDLTASTFGQAEQYKKAHFNEVGKE